MIRERDKNPLEKINASLIYYAEIANDKRAGKSS
jgi:hypothetical protein